MGLRPCHALTIVQSLASVALTRKTAMPHLQHPPTVAVVGAGIAGAACAAGLLQPGLA